MAQPGSQSRDPAPHALKDLTSTFRRLGIWGAVETKGVLPIRLLNEGDGCASLSLGFQNQMASPADLLLFPAMSPQVS